MADAQELLLCWNLYSCRQQLLDLVDMPKKKRKEKSGRILTRSKGGCSRRIDHQDGPGYVFSSEAAEAAEAEADRKSVV